MAKSEAKIKSTSRGLPRPFQISIKSFVRKVIAEEREQIVNEAVARVVASNQDSDLSANDHALLKAWHDEPVPTDELVEMVHTRVQV